MKKWIAYAAYRCEIAGFATDTIDIQCRYFEFENEAEIEPALQNSPTHTYLNEAVETVAWIYVKCLIIWDFDQMPKHGEEFGGVHVNAHEIRNLCMPPIKLLLAKQAPENCQQFERHQKLSEEDIRICSQALNEVCHGAYARPDWEFATLMGAEKSEAQDLMRKLDYVNHNAYQNRQLTHEQVFVLHHENHMTDDRDDAKLLGIYSTHVEAQRQIDTHFKNQLGFNQPDGEFSIDCYEIGKNNWLEGFATIYHGATMDADELRALMPIKKTDTEKAESIVALGFPIVEPVLDDILKWMRDINWPVARFFEPFLVSIGAPLTPHIQAILKTDDDVWKYWIVQNVIGKSPALTQIFMAELQRIATKPTENKHKEEVDLVAKEILDELNAN
ncbi:MAG: DUF5071 domain-containing protein [Bdellovibrio sp.]|nr:DUF5071 domain-containing protein [Methylotenera sp.]